jgi:hypothetical protein
MHEELEGGRGLQELDPGLGCYSETMSGAADLIRAFAGCAILNQLPAPFIVFA